MAFLHDGRSSREPFLNAPQSVLWLIGALLLAHGIRIVLPGFWPERIVAEFAFIPARYSGAPEFAGENIFQQAIPFVSHIFLHANLTHVGINCLWLLAFGPVVARRLKPLPFLLFFLLCGIGGIVLHLAVYWGSEMAVVGASGAIAGLMGAAMRIAYGGFYGRRLAPIFSPRIVAFSAIWMTVNVLGGVLGLGATQEVVLVAWVVHLGGYLAGLFAIDVFDRQSMTQAAGIGRWN